MNRACPSCPDGYVWTREGPTGKACPTCKGKAYLGDDDEDLRRKLRAEQLQVGYATRAKAQQKRI